ncbi:MAG: hypothetical protein JO263_08010 [Candidatus Eremiobacteraeota bacterium]|nr:hypothetical protein [Candidatus Eremiobacteraeota bacterium]
MLWLTNLPSWIAFALVVGAANAIALGMTLSARRWYQRRGVAAGPPIVGAWATCLGALAAVLCAFTIITLWSIFARAQSNTDGEAAAIRLVTREISFAQLPILRAYVNGSAQEWPQMCGGKPDQRVVASLMVLARTAKPRVPEYGSDLYRQLATLEDARYQRWQISSASTPIELKIALCIIAITLFGVLAIALPDRLDTHLALTVLTATALGSVFWVMVALSYPYCGSYFIGPDQIITSVRADR